MGFLDRLLGREEGPRRRAETGATSSGASVVGGHGVATGPAMPPAGAERSADEIAIERYRYLLRTAPPETVEQAHAEAFARLTLEQRRQVLTEVGAQVPPAERATSDDPQALARMATRAEMRAPGTLERTFAGTGAAGFGTAGPGGRGAGGVGLGAGGIGLGGMLAGSLLASVAGAFIGTAVADALFDLGGSGDVTAAGDAGPAGDAGSAADGAAAGDGAAGADDTGSAADEVVDTGTADAGWEDSSGDLGGDWGGGDLFGGFGGDSGGGFGGDF